MHTSLFFPFLTLTKWTARVDDVMHTSKAMRNHRMRSSGAIKAARRRVLKVLCWHESFKKSMEGINFFSNTAFPASYIRPAPSNTDMKMAVSGLLSYVFLKNSICWSSVTASYIRWKSAWRRADLVGAVNWGK